MVKHIVFFKLSPSTLPENNQLQLKKMQESNEHKEAIRKGLEIKKSKAVIDYEF
jgi:hypothetical protein